MKFIVPLFLVFVSTSVMAEYRPGRIRVDARGTLQASEATGAFENVTQATISQEVQDDAGIVYYLVMVKNEFLRFSVTKVQSDRCGEIRTAEARADNATLVLRLKDTAASECRESNPEWLAEIRPAAENDNSHLVLKGNPERFLLTQ